MYVCINCGVESEELYRRYCPSVLKVLKCENCGLIADKYIEYDPVIVFLDLVLIEKAAYRHLLYNSNFKSYWKLMIILWLAESFCTWSSCKLMDEQLTVSEIDIITNDIFEGHRNFYILLVHTAISLGAFICTVIVTAEVRWMIFDKKPHRYSATDLYHALIIGGCAKLLSLLGIVWKHIAGNPHYIFIQGYTILCLLTAYSVVCKSGKAGSLIGLAGGFMAYYYFYNTFSTLSIPMFNITLT